MHNNAGMNIIYTDDTDDNDGDFVDDVNVCLQAVWSPLPCARWSAKKDSMDLISSGIKAQACNAWLGFGYSNLTWKRSQRMRITTHREICEFRPKSVWPSTLLLAGVCVKTTDF